jgi:hypothetical protein
MQHGVIEWLDLCINVRSIRQKLIQRQSILYELAPN